MTPVSNTQIATTSAAPVQIGPVYHCAKCGARAKDGLCWRLCNSPLDEWANHIYYLIGTGCKCGLRYARLGDGITPIEFIELDTFQATIQANITAIREGLVTIARAVPPEDQSLDRAAWIIHNLLAGRITPDAAIAAIRGLPGAPATTGQDLSL